MGWKYHSVYSILKTYFADISYPGIRLDIYTYLLLYMFRHFDNEVYIYLQRIKKELLCNKNIYKIKSWLCIYMYVYENN